MTMRNIHRSTAFKRDYTRERKRQHREALDELLQDVFSVLATDQPLDPRFRDHNLSGDWDGHRECHLKPDLLLIYRKLESGVLELVRLGSHSELFR